MVVNRGDDLTFSQPPLLIVVWRACVTDDGLDYYVNTETNETTWDKPEEVAISLDPACPSHL